MLFKTLNNPSKKALRLLIYKSVLFDNKRLQLVIYESKRLLTESFFVLHLPLCRRNDEALQKISTA